MKNPTTIAIKGDFSNGYSYYIGMPTGQQVCLEDVMKANQIGGRGTLTMIWQPEDDDFVEVNGKPWPADEESVPVPETEE